MGESLDFGKRNMNTVLKGLAMGDYTLYVWTAYGAACAVILINLVGIQWRRKQTLKKLQQWFGQQR